MENTYELKSSILLTLNDNKEYLRALEKFFAAIKGPETISKDNLGSIREELSRLQESTIRISILRDAFSLILNQPQVLKEVNYDLEFIKFAKHFTESLSQDHNFESLTIHSGTANLKPSDNL